MSWRDRPNIVEFRVLAEALETCCGEGSSSTLDLRSTDSEKKGMVLLVFYGYGMWNAVH